MSLLKQKYQTVCKLSLKKEFENLKLYFPEESTGEKPLWTLIRQDFSGIY